ncbi:CoA transferase [Nocardiopsis composta]|uniref:Crotonobetainyl-CoA:carnitine CoA-transferase CaiB-like acyl-CoA transferase n=1 Tax=Nocardiopsis composta TaxID=157465 RepID=A0A7W8QIH8_9ACTN|nr:CoA transferase [Nocardiopsis composta]MBB5431113.1 crotonobetainyl-CoA:carnitine CoA-transferase CaiB-like acyl-CoA transferase [Nocardiopsis composta]
MTAAPLSGAVAHAFGDSAALRTAAARLSAMGCTVVRRGGPPPPGAPAGWIGLVRDPGAGRTGEPPIGCAIGWSGPVAADLPGERAVQAACGLAHLHGRARGGPRFLGVDYASVCAGVLAAQAVAAAALFRARGGPALSAAVSAAQAALLAAGPHIAAATAPDDGPGAPADPAGRHCTPPFRTSDGVRLEIETLDAEAWADFWADLGASPAAAAAGWPPFQSRFGTARCPLPAELGAVIAARDGRRVRAAARRSGVGLTPIRTAAEAAAAHRPEPEWRLHPCDGGPAPALPPAPPGRAPLAGLRVVEATTRIQGPLAGLLLAMLGAEVVRIEPPGGDPMRGVPPTAGGTSARFRALNRGKEAVQTDLKTPAGRRTARDLAASAHVFLHNWPPGRAERFGLGPGDLAAPGLVHVHAGGWDGDPPADPGPATDYPVQAHGGVADLLAAPGEEPAPSLLTLTDVLGGLIAAEGALAGLLLRARTGTGAVAATALADAARLLRDTGRGAAPTGGDAPVPADSRAASTGVGPAPTGAVRGASTEAAPGSASPFAGGTPGPAGGDRAGASTREAELRAGRGAASTGAAHGGTPPGAGRGAPEPATDLAALAAAPEFAAAFDTVGGASCPRPPWDFAPAGTAPIGAVPADRPDIRQEVPR